MGKLWFMVVTIIIYGSLYPFDFSRAYPPEGLLARFLENGWVRPSRGDILANLILYLPFGFIGVWALLRRMEKSQSVVVVIALGILLSLTIEIAQIFAAGRTSSLLDLGLNIVSTTIGAVVARMVNNDVDLRITRTTIKIHDPFALILAACWVAYRLVPFVPTIDFQHIKDALKPLLILNAFSPWNCLRYLIAWLLFAYLVRVATSIDWSRRALPIVGIIAVIAPIGIVGRVIRPEEIVAIMAASVLWLVIAQSRLVRPALLVLLVAVVVSIQLAPFDFSGNSRQFSWLPFGSFITGTLEVGIFALFEKFFLYGTLVWLLMRSRLPAALASVLVAILLLFLELCQLYTPERSPEITDSIIALVAGWMCASLSPRPQRECPPAKVPPNRHRTTRTRPPMPR